MRPGAVARLRIQIVADVETAIGLVARMESQREKARHLSDQDLLGQIKKQGLGRDCQVCEHEDLSTLLHYKQAIGFSRWNTHSYGSTEGQRAESRYGLVSPTRRHRRHAKRRIGDTFDSIRRLGDGLDSDAQKKRG